MQEEAHPFSPLWNKYRPVILKLMSGAVSEPQQYQLFTHEFKSLSKKDKVSFNFLLEAHNGKALNNIKASQPALDLLFVLQQSKTAQQLMTEATYEFSLDKKFIFHVNRKALDASASN
jgi:hypothetical protein